MITVFKKFLNSFIEKSDIWFFYAFLVTSTLSVRKVLLYYPINNNFNEYTGIYLYLSDIFLFLTITSWLLALCNKNSILSIINRAYQQVIHNYVLILLLFIAIFSFLSILWSSNQQIALFRSIKLLGLILIFFYVLKNVPRGTFLKRFLQIIMVTSIIQSVIGIIQFIIQHSIGLLWLKESILSPQITGVAKVIFDGHIYIRAYGLFPHPNILGGFLVFSIISTLLYLKIFHQNTAKCSTPACPVGRWNILSRSNNIEIVPPARNASSLNSSQENYASLQNVPRGTFLDNFMAGGRGTFVILFIISIQGLSLLLTFSKSAIIGLSIGLFYLYITKCSTWNIIRGKRGTSSNWVNIIKMFHACLSGRRVEHFYRKVFLFLSIVILFFLVLKPDTYSLIFKSLQERTFYLNVSRGTFLSHPLIGIGAGQFIINMQNIPNLKEWQYQPVHNVFLLILNEFGVFVFFAFLYFIYKILRIHPAIVKCSTCPKCHLSECISEKLCAITNCSTWNNFREFHGRRAWNILKEKLVMNVPPARNATSQNLSRDNCELLQNVPRGTFLNNFMAGGRGTFDGTGVEHYSRVWNIYFKAILVSFIFIMLFDHYFWDIQQGQILIWLLFGIIAGSNRENSKFDI